MRSQLLGFAMFVLIGAAGALHAQGRQAAPPAPAATAAGATKDVSVTITYTGKGAVDPGHSILVFLFSDPNIGPASQPIGPPEVATKNGAVVTFKNVSTTPVYVVAVYNERGTYDGRSGPPTAGLPIAAYARDAKSPPTPVTPGAKTAIKMTFNDAKRWGQTP